MTETDIEEQSWKYSEGFSIGDWIDFNNSTFSLSSDTIYLNGQPAAKIISSKSNIFESKKIYNNRIIPKERKRDLYWEVILNTNYKFQPTIHFQKSERVKFPFSFVPGLTLLI